MAYMKPVVVAIALISITACSGNKKDLPKLDYQTQTRKIVKLEVPPDLTNPDQGNLYQVPAGSGAVRASDLSRRTSATQQAANSEVLKSVKGVRLERDGNQRWVEVQGKSPAEIWPLLKAFWQENGFDIKSEEPGIGQMETEWAENRAKIPQDGLRRLLDKVGLGGIYSTSERDKFIIRIEQGRIDGNTLLVSGDYGRNWRRTALALDRIGLNVLGQNIERHAFLVQQAPNESDAVSTKKPGFFGRMLGKGKKVEKPAAYPEIIVFVEPVNGGSRIRLLNKDGSAYNGSDASTLLSRLHTELR